MQEPFNSEVGREHCLRVPSTLDKESVEIARGQLRTAERLPAQGASGKGSLTHLTRTRHPRKFPSEPQARPPRASNHRVSQAHTGSHGPEIGPRHDHG